MCNEKNPHNRNNIKPVNEITLSKIRQVAHVKKGITERNAQRQNLPLNLLTANIPMFSHTYVGASLESVRAVAEQMPRRDPGSSVREGKEKKIVTGNDGGEGEIGGGWLILLANIWIVAFTSIDTSSGETVAELATSSLSLFLSLVGKTSKRCGKKRNDRVAARRPRVYTAFRPGH